MQITWITVVIAVSATFELSTQESSDESRLVESLLTSYRPGYLNSRPVLDSKASLSVGLGLTLIDIPQFDTKTGLGTFVCFDKLSWKDAHLSWDPSQFGNLNSIRLPSDQIWTPDIVLYNSHEMNVDRMSSLAVVNYDGSVLWVPRSKYTIRCYIEEDQEYGTVYKCRFKFGSWTYNGDFLDPTLHTNSTDISSFFANHEWEIVENIARKDMQYYDCCPEPYPDVSFYLTLNYKGAEPTTQTTCESSTIHGVSFLLVLALLSIHI